MTTLGDKLSIPKYGPVRNAAPEVTEAELKRRQTAKTLALMLSRIPANSILRYVQSRILCEDEYHEDIFAEFPSYFDIPDLRKFVCALPADQQALLLLTFRTIPSATLRR